MPDEFIHPDGSDVFVARYVASADLRLKLQDVLASAQDNSPAGQHDKRPDLDSPGWRWFRKNRVGLDALARLNCERASRSLSVRFASVRTALGAEQFSNYLAAFLGHAEISLSADSSKLEDECFSWLCRQVSGGDLKLALHRDRARMLCDRQLRDLPLIATAAGLRGLRYAVTSRTLIEVELLTADDLMSGTVQIFEPCFETGKVRALTVPVEKFRAAAFVSAEGAEDGE
ncbi:hypothetical protein ACFQY5_18950 [Paeniroseomonas aquatica]|uniref:Uncharacterized protein n=1 Tax=Paeniroseomonas aquatica TaxID=373043 RepID=A0ABT8ADV9_9PROT|nr:hypothetical protein [Paeniroseomonas aquatica]MDN3568007.1 hypothetical protein [Paeniroseomonas aquatica]